MKNRSILEKTLFGIIAVMLIYATVVTFEKIKFKNKYNTEVERQINIVNDSIEVLNVRVMDLKGKLQNQTKSIKRKSKSINDKLIKDEKEIDNGTVTGDELADFIAKHEKG